MLQVTEGPEPSASSPAESGEGIVGALMMVMQKRSKAQQLKGCSSSPRPGEWPNDDVMKVMRYAAIPVAQCVSAICQPACCLLSVHSLRLIFHYPILKYSNETLSTDVNILVNC